MFRAAVLIACCWAVATTAAPAPQNSMDVFAGESPLPGGASLGTFLQSLSTVTDLLNRFTRTFGGPAQLSEFDDVERAQPRVSLTEEKDANGASIYKVIREPYPVVMVERQQTHQPKYKTNHELFSDEEEEETEEDQVDRSAHDPILFLLKNNPARYQYQYQQHQQPEYRSRETLESLEEINRSGNRLEDNQNDLTEFEREWYSDPQPQLADDIRVNRIFRTRNANYHNPEAESFGVQKRHFESAHKNPIK